MKARFVVYKDTEKYEEWVTIASVMNPDMLWEMIRDAAEELQRAFEDTAKERGKHMLDRESKIVITMKDKDGFTRVGFEGILYRDKVVEV